LFALDRELPDNTKLSGSLFLAGLWLLFLATVFPSALGEWRFAVIWTGWTLVGLAFVLFARQKLKNRRQQNKLGNHSSLRRT